MRLKGRVDRVDFSARGYHIIDYKTSRVPRSESKMVLFPSEARTDRVKLSVQGAVYALAWAARAPDHPVADFSLYRLKNLDPEADVMLRTQFGESPFTRGSPAEERMRETYEPIAERLAHGHFAAKPLHSGVCAFCPATHACPVPRTKGAGA